MKNYSRLELKSIAAELFKPKAQAKFSIPKKPSRLKLASAKLLAKLKSK
jgi:hypothetical protein